ncbi:hypothetical protein HanIR_Chr12g0605531 [Helianthus annuus]|nr:hypothetical protein HanIR_Chr12g0605531 [Helianthus annuus]
MGTVQHRHPSVAVPLSIASPPSPFLQRRQRRGQDVWDAHKRTNRLGLSPTSSQIPITTNGGTARDATAAAYSEERSGAFGSHHRPCSVPIIITFCSSIGTLITSVPYFRFRSTTDLRCVSFKSVVCEIVRGIRLDVHGFGVGFVGENGFECFVHGL